MGATSSNYQVDLNEDSDPINWDGKLDWNISSKDLATFRVDYQHIINHFVVPLGNPLDQGKRILIAICGAGMAG
jgi:hypothetical protein